METTDYQPIENYGLIGDLNTIALVGLNGSIDFMCFPDFDSPSIFASLLDVHKGGSFTIGSVDQGVKNKQIYLPDSNILITRFLSEEGVAEIIDFMPISNVISAHTLIRRVTAVRGAHHFYMRCSPRFNYALSGHRVIYQKYSMMFIGDPGVNLGLHLQSTVPLQIKEKDAYARFTLNQGESVDFVLHRIGTPIKQEEISPLIDQSLVDTMHYWRGWISKSQYKGRWQEMVNRSALLLKLMTSKKYGSIIAAPTFSLPEKIGEDKNWDYRYTWIRDSAFVLYALIRLGFTEEAKDFIHWIESYCCDIQEPGKLNLMYALSGGKDLEEKALTHFEGYKKSSPVRIGNGAYEQLQLDIYGELIDSIYLYNKYGELISSRLWDHLSKHVDWLVDNWEQPDEGIWEVRGGRHEFLYSRLMCWVAFDRMLRIARDRSFPFNKKWIEQRDKIYHSILNDFWSEDLQAFVQAKDHSNLDASVLLMPLTRFISPTDPRWLSTLKSLENELVTDSLVYRYKLSIPLASEEAFSEGTFSLCSFWYVEALSRAGYVEKARYFFEKMLSYANHLGLYAEQLNLKGEHLGNFPQAFTHLGLISAAYNLNQNLNQYSKKYPQ